jgi:pyrroloquinoline quinone biosynthesis protein A
VSCSVNPPQNPATFLGESSLNSVVAKNNRSSYTSGSFLDQASLIKNLKLLEVAMKWETPSYTDLRFGFEVTMYIMNR